MKNTVYFEGFNGIRLIAALAVIVHHIEQIKRIYHFPNIYNVPLVKELGGMGVTLFFVLSGFLITYLLLAEKDLVKTIDVRKFYIRRILRIWPLYYFMVIISFVFLHFVFPVPGTENLQENYGGVVLCFAFMMPNVAMISFPIVPFISPLWSVGVEEQFYLIWPVLLKYFKNILLLLFTVIIAMALLRFGLVRLSFYTESNIPLTLFNFFKFFRIDCMAIGGVFAYLFFYRKEDCVKYIFSKITQIISFLLLIVVVYFQRNSMFFNQYISILFALILLNLGGNKKSLLKLSGSFFYKGGEISFGLYVYHSFICFMVIANLEKIVDVENTVLFNFVLYIAVIGLTGIVSWFSYNYMEKRFLSFKKKYTIVTSGEDAKQE